MDTPTFITDVPNDLAELGIDDLSSLPRTKSLVVIEGPPCSGKSTAVRILSARQKCVRLVQARQDLGGSQLKAEIDAHLNRVGIDLLIIDDLDCYNKAIQATFISGLNSSRTRCPTIVTCTCRGLLNETILSETDKVYCLEIKEDTMLKLAAQMCVQRHIPHSPTKLRSVVESCRDYRDVHNKMQTLFLKYDGRTLDCRGLSPPVVWSQILEQNVAGAYERINYMTAHGQCLAEILEDVKDYIFDHPGENLPRAILTIEHINATILKAQSCTNPSMIIHNFCARLCKLISPEF